MHKERFALAGLTFAGIGICLGIALSSSIPNTPAVFGTTLAVFAAVGAAVIGGLRKQRAEPSR